MGAKRSGSLVLVVILSVSLLQAPLGRASLVEGEEFAVLYSFDPGTGSIVHTVVGQYSAAVQCREEWSFRDLLREPMPGLPPAGGGVGVGRTVRYGADVDAGRLRVTEVNGTSVLRDELHACPSFFVDATPASMQGPGVVSFRMAAKAGQPACAAAPLAGAQGLAPRDYSVRGAAKDVPIRAKDAGMCFDLEYVGLAPAGSPSCASRGWSTCVPFSGNVAGTIILYASGAAEPSVMLSGRACDFMVVGGYCWNRNVAGSTQGAGWNVTPAWSPFDGTGRMEVKVSSPSRDLTGLPVDAEQAVGSWAAYAYRADGGL